MTVTLDAAETEPINAGQPIDSTTHPIINSPYDQPSRYWKLDQEHHAISEQVAGHRPSANLPAVPTPRTNEQLSLDQNQLVNDIREAVGAWRAAGYPGATANTKRLLTHWTNPLAMRRLFFAHLADRGRARRSSASGRQVAGPCRQTKPGVAIVDGRNICILVSKRSSTAAAFASMERRSTWACLLDDSGRLSAAAPHSRGRSPQPAARARSTSAAEGRDVHPLEAPRLVPRCEHAAAGQVRQIQLAADSIRVGGARYGIPRGARRRLGE